MTEPSPRSERAATPVVAGGAALGVAGSLLVAYAAPGAVADRVVGWWYVPGAPAGRAASLVLIYAGMAAMCAAWLALGRALPSRQVPAGDRGGLDASAGAGTAAVQPRRLQLPGPGD